MLLPSVISGPCQETNHSSPGTQLSPVHQNFMDAPESPLRKFSCYVLPPSNMNWLKWSFAEVYRDFYAFHAKHQLLPAVLSDSVVCANVLKYIAVCIPHPVFRFVIPLSTSGKKPLLVSRSTFSCSFDTISASRSCLLIITGEPSYSSSLKSHVVMQLRKQRP
jgi:hypothetical protein